MIAHRTLASAMLAAFGVVGAVPVGARAAAVSVVSVVAARPTPNDPTVTALSVVPRTGHADVVVRVDGSVTLKHFTLSNPDKIVVDLNGASLGLPEGDAYDGVARGGITRIRYSQFTKSTVRVVLTLDAAHAYEVTQQNGEIRISVETTGVDFSPWSVKGSATAADEPAAPARATPVEEEVRPEARPADTRSSSSRKAVAPQQSQEPRITVSWENAPISDVLGIFASFSGRTILPSKNVTGTVSAIINNQPWDVALRKVMNANGYDVTIDDTGVILVDTYEAIAARQATIPLDTRTVRLNYSRAASVRPMIEARLTRNCPQTAMSMANNAPVFQPVPGQPTATPMNSNVGAGMPTVGVGNPSCPARGAVTADTITNSVSITDVPSALPGLIEYTKTLDLRQPQVNIKARIISVDRSTLEGLGLRYDLGSQQQFFNDIVPRLDSTGKPRTDAGQILLGGNTVSAIANASARIPSAALQLVYSTAMGNFDFTTFLEALQTNTLLDVQAEPSASVLNNYTANLTAGTQVPIRVIDAGSAAGNTSNAPRASVSMQQTGIILTVTPQVTANHQIQMKVHVENSDVQFQTSDVGAVFPTQKVDNVVLVADGETAVMAGLTQTSVSVTRTGLPVLVDLPIIGRLFGVTNREERKRDLLILITPHIIDDGQQMPESGRP